MSCTNTPIAWFEIPPQIERSLLRGVTGARPAQMVKLCKRCSSKVAGAVELARVCVGHCGFGFNAPPSVVVHRRKKG